MSDNGIDIKDYFNEKFNELKETIKDLKGELKDNQQSIIKRIEKIEDDLLFYRFALKYKKLFIAGVIALMIITGFQVYSTLNKFVEFKIEHKDERCNTKDNK